VISFLKTYGLCSESLHCAKSTLEKLENDVAIVGLGYKVLVLETIHREQLGANMVQ